MSYSRELSNLADNLDIIRKSVKIQLEDLPEGKIIVSRQIKNGKKYVIYKQQDIKGKYLCITKNRELIKLLSIKSFYSVYYTLLNELIELLTLATEASEKININHIKRTAGRNQTICAI